MVPVLWFLAAAALAGVPAVDVATPPSELSLVPDAVPSLVAETSVYGGYYCDPGFWGQFRFYSDFPI
jgi:hypothetical protein